ncbi:MAG: hypothetical protein MUF73_01475 [Rhodobacteraceae bacterium]|jgi:hypothetical protein|nr:hypothetical protein [Paracoccaceae bacterium]
MAWKMFGRVEGAFTSGETTFDLRLPLWPDLALIWAGIAVSLVTIGVKILGILAGHETVVSADGSGLDEAERGLR